MSLGKRHFQTFRPRACQIPRIVALKKLWGTKSTPNIIPQKGDRSPTDFPRRPWGALNHSAGSLARYADEPTWCLAASLVLLLVLALVLVLVLPLVLVLVLVLILIPATQTCTSTSINLI